MSDMEDVIDVQTLSGSSTPTSVPSSSTPTMIVPPDPLAKADTDFNALADQIFLSSRLSLSANPIDMIAVSSYMFIFVLIRSFSFVIDRERIRAWFTALKSDRPEGIGYVRHTRYTLHVSGKTLMRQQQVRTDVLGNGRLRPRLNELDPSFIDTLHTMDRVMVEDGALDRKTKRLMALSCVAVRMCEDCVYAQARVAKNYGATKEEILEAIKVAVLIGGVPCWSVAKRGITKLFAEWDE